MFQKIRPATLLLIAGTMAGGLPHERMLLEPEPDPSAGGGGGGGGSGDDQLAKTFSQDDVNRIVQREKAALERKIGELQKQAETAAKVPELERQLEELRMQLETAGKSAEEKARIQAEQAARKVEQERQQREQQLAELTRSLEQEREAHRSTRLRYAATSALTEAKAFPQALPDAITSFLGAAEIDFDDKGEVAAVRYGGIAHKTMRDAAAAFLRDRPYFAAAPAGGGSGTPRPNAGGAPSGDWKNRPASELFALGLKSSAFGAGPSGDDDDD